MVLLPCGNCCSKCIVFKSEGWAGWIVDEDMGFRFGNGAIINGEGFSASEDAKPFTLTWYANTPAHTLAILFSATVIRATFTFGFSGPSIVLESSDVEGFESGSEVTLSTVVSNTTSSEVDLYGKKMVDTVGRIIVRRGGVAACDCNCQANYFKPSSADIQPETYKLQFTNVAARPSGPRSPALGDPLVGSGAKAFGKYAPFVPPNSVECIQNFFGFVQPAITLSGCDSYLSRIQSPIILRRVLNSTYRFYASDPILIRPCREVRYLFYACDPSPALQVAVQIGTSGSLNQTSVLGYIFSDKPPCIWNRQQYENDPDAYEQAINSNVYTFGNFATVSPGGTYQTETRTICTPPDGSAESYQYSLAEGCNGRKCPPSEVIVTISSSVRIPAGAYSVPLQSLSCVAGSANACSYFAQPRAYYFGSFNIDGLRFNFTVYRQASSGSFPNAGWSAPDDCGCEARVLSMVITYQSAYYEGSSNASRYPTGNRCFPICSDGSEAVFENFGVQEGSSGINLGRITVKF
jgi:hypothetical protein